MHVPSYATIICTVYYLLHSVMVSPPQATKSLSPPKQEPNKFQISFSCDIPLPVSPRVCLVSSYSFFVLQHFYFVCFKILVFSYSKYTQPTRAVLENWGNSSPFTLACFDLFAVHISNLFSWLCFMHEPSSLFVRYVICIFQ